MYSWGSTPYNCIPPIYRPTGPLSKSIIIRISKLALIAPNKKGLDVSKKLIILAILDRQLASSNSGTFDIQVEDVSNALDKMVKLLTAVRDINIARCIDDSFLRGHKLRSDDPYEWEFDTVVALGDLVSLTRRYLTRVTQAGDLWRTQFATRLKDDPESTNHVIAADIKLAVDDFRRRLDEDQTTGADDGVGDPANPIYDEKQPKSTQSGHFCTTGAIFQPALPPLTILLCIGQMYYNARNQPAPRFKNIPIIMTQEVATKGMYYNNGGVENVGTFLKLDGRNYSYKNFYSNMTAILELEERFGKPFWEIFECPDIQAQQAVRMAKDILPTLAGITRLHSINQVATLKDVCSEYFDKYPDPEKTRKLTTENVRQLSNLLSTAARADADGVKYKGWPSLGGVTAGPATPLPTPGPKQQTRRRISELSPTIVNEQPVTKKPKPLFNAAARAAYVANHVPGRDAMLYNSPYRRPAIDQAITPAGRSQLVVKAGQMREFVPSRLQEIGTPATPTPASRIPLSHRSPEGGLQNEGAQSDLGTDKVKTTLGLSSVESNSLAICRDAQGDDAAESLEMAGKQADENLETGMQLHAETAFDFEAFTKLGEEFQNFQQRFIATAEGLRSQMEVRANQVENALGSTQTEVQELKQKLQEATDKIKEANIKAETAEEKAKEADGRAEKAEKRAKEAEQKLDQKVKDLQELAESSRRLWTQLAEIDKK